MDTKKVIFLVALIAGCAAPPPPKTDYSSFFSYTEPDSRIVGGTFAADGTHPHMAALTTGVTVHSYLCGASIVGSRHLITAAHCFPFNTDTLSVYVGSNQPGSGSTVYSILRAIPHPNYDSWLVKNDIAILETTTPMVFGPNVQPIAISYESIGAGVLSRVAGWGRTAFEGSSPASLVELETTTNDREQCVQDAIAAAIEFDVHAPPVSPDVELCTFHAVGYGACHGDSGSPLVKVDTNEQIGVVSWGFLCASGGPDVFARISAYKDWIQENTDS